MDENNINEEIVNKENALKDAESTKNNNGAIIITIICVFIAIIAIIVGVVVVMNQNEGDDSSDRINASSRDTQRRYDLAMFSTSVTQYQSNNRGMLPKGPSYWKGASSFNCGNSETACRFINNYLSQSNTSNSFRDPSGVFYSLYITENAVDGEITTSLSGNNSKLVKSGSGYTIGGSSPYGEHIIYLIPGAECDGSVAVEATTKRSYAILYQLEVNNNVLCMGY